MPVPDDSPQHLDVGSSGSLCILSHRGHGERQRELTSTKDDETEDDANRPVDFRAHRLGQEPYAGELTECKQCLTPDQPEYIARRSAFEQVRKWYVGERLVLAQIRRATRSFPMSLDAESRWVITG